MTLWNSKVICVITYYFKIVNIANSCNKFNSFYFYEFTSQSKACSEKSHLNNIHHLCYGLSYIFSNVRSVRFISFTSSILQGSHSIEHHHGKHFYSTSWQLIFQCHYCGWNLRSNCVFSIQIAGSRERNHQCIACLCFHQSKQRTKIKHNELSVLFSTMNEDIFHHITFSNCNKNTLLH